MQYCNKNNAKFTSLMLLTSINVFLRPSEAEILYRDNHDMCKRFFDNNLKTYAYWSLKVSWVPTNSTIAVIFNPITSYLRP